MTGQTALPCSALADYFPWVERLGPNATYAGNLRFAEHESGWTCQLDGLALDQIDLSRLTDSLPHRVTGIASVHFNRATIDPGRNINVAARVFAQEGWIGRSLLASLAQRVGLMVDPGAMENEGSVGYSQASFHASITNERMTLTGICQPYQDFQSQTHMTNVALCAWGRPIAVTSGADFASDELTGALNPARRELRWWNLILLPSPQTSDDDPISARISRQRSWSGGELIRQR